MPELKLTIQLVEDDGQIHQNETTIDLSELRDPYIKTQEDRLQVLNRVSSFMRRSLSRFIEYWVISARARVQLENLDNLGRGIDLDESTRGISMVSYLHSEEGTQTLNLPLQVLEPKEGKDFPRPKFRSRYERDPVL